MELALHQHTCHMCMTVQSCPVVPLAQGISSARHSGVAGLSCWRSALRSGRLSELLLSPALSHHISYAVREGLRAEQLWGAGLQWKPPLFGLPAGRKWDYIQLGKASQSSIRSSSQQTSHIFLGEKEWYWVGEKLQSHLYVLWESKSCVLCTCLYSFTIKEGYQKTERNICYCPGGERLAQTK